jgi:mannose/fructose/N-acetylgalactosamine-specific phosphotransferase system component IID
MTTCDAATGLSKMLCNIQGLFNAVIPLLIALGVVYFVWGVVRYMIGDSEEAKKKGKDGIIFGIIGLAVIISLWGLVTIVLNTFGLENSSAPSPSDLQKLLPQ